MKKRQLEAQRTKVESIGRAGFPEAKRVVPVLYLGEWLVEIWGEHGATLHLVTDDLTAEEGVDMRVETAAADAEAKRHAAAQRAVATRRRQEKAAPADDDLAARRKAAGRKAAETRRRREAERRAALVGA